MSYVNSKSSIKNIKNIRKKIYYSLNFNLFWSSTWIVLHLEFALCQSTPTGRLCKHKGKYLILWYCQVRGMNKTYTRMSESVSCQVVSLEKSHVTHGASIWLHPCTHRAKYFVKTTEWTEQDTLILIMYPDMPKAVAPVLWNTNCISLTFCNLST